MLTNADFYSRNHKIQTTDANRLLDQVLPQMSFGKDDVVMDIGCGSGGNTRDVFLFRIPKLKKLIAMDKMPEMIEHASVHAPNEKIEYHVANIMDKSSLKQWEGLISKAFSLHCFQWLRNQKVGFQNIYDLLRPQGEIAMLFTLRAPLWESYPYLLKNNKWNQYLKDADQCVPESHHLNHGAVYFRELLEDLGFEVLLCVEDISIHSCKTDKELKDVLTTISSLAAYISDELREEFVEDLFQKVLEFSGRNSEGLPLFSYDILIVHARKP